MKECYLITDEKRKDAQLHWNQVARELTTWIVLWWECARGRGRDKGENMSEKKAIVWKRRELDRHSKQKSRGRKRKWEVTRWTVHSPLFSSNWRSCMQSDHLECSASVGSSDIAYTGHLALHSFSRRALFPWWNETWSCTTHAAYALQQETWRAKERECVCECERERRTERLEAASPPHLQYPTYTIVSLEADTIFSIEIHSHATLEWNLLTVFTGKLYAVT